jgi:hypothetical protein
LELSALITEHFIEDKCFSPEVIHLIAFADSTLANQKLSLSRKAHEKRSQSQYLLELINQEVAGQ